MRWSISLATQDFTIYYSQWLKKKVLDEPFSTLMKTYREKSQRIYIPSFEEDKLLDTKRSKGIRETNKVPKNADSEDLYDKRDNFTYLENKGKSSQT